MPGTSSRCSSYYTLSLSKAKGQRSRLPARGPAVNPPFFSLHLRQAAPLNCFLTTRRRGWCVSLVHSGAPMIFRKLKSLHRERLPKEQEQENQEFTTTMRPEAKFIKPVLPKNHGFNDFQFGQTLGTGSFGRVKTARYLRTTATTMDDPTSIPPRVAIKILKKAEIIRLRQVDHITNEKEILLALDHPLTVRCFGSFQDQRYLYIVLEMVQGGEFFTHLRRKGRFDNETAAFYASQICDVFDYLHARNVIYRDLKPENMLLNKDGYVKLTDFGFAKVVEFRTDTLCGTPEYLAPEVIQNKGMHIPDAGLATLRQCPPF
eukprot:GHVT01015290.1.p1 GENE.GHVT01015290.1~~GHVT01015290.1.p1  ORF type:complete len:318 (-),score=12.13 GHVT01015290.1:4436-5389(-)